MPIVNIQGVGQVNFPDSMSQDEIAQAIQRNLNPSNTPKTLNKAQNIWDSISNSNLGSGLISVAKGLGDFGKDITLGLADPAVQAAVGTQNLISRGLGAATGRPAEDFGQYDVNLIDKASSPEIATIASIPGAFALPGNALLQGARGVKAIATGAGLGGAYGAAFGASHDPNSDILSDAALGAGISAAIPLGAQALQGGMNAIKGVIAKRKLNKLEKSSQDPYSGVASPQQVAKKLDTIGEEVPIDLGTLTGSVKEANKYKKSTNLWGSNNEARMREAIAKTDQTADLLASEMSQGANTEAEATRFLQNHIQDNHIKFKKKFEEADNEIATLARENRVDTTNRPNSARVSGEILDRLADIDQKGGFSNLKNDKGLVRLIENIKSGGSPVSTDIATGAPIKVKQDYDDLKNLRTYVGKQIGNLQKAPIDKRDWNTINELGRIYGALDDDMGQALKSYPSMLPKWEERSKIYREDVKPYEKNRIINEIVNSDDQKLLFNKLNSTEKDIKKVVSHMSPEAQKLLLGLGFKGAIKNDLATGEIIGKAAQISRGYERLNNSPILKNVLDEKDHALFKKLGTLHELTRDYRPLLKNPETGAKNTRLLQEAALAIPSALGLGAGAVSGTGLLPAVGAAAATGAYVKGKNVLSDIMANPKIAQAYANPEKRNALVKEAMRQEPKGKDKSVLSKIIQKASQISTSPSVINYLLNDLGK